MRISSPRAPAIRTDGGGGACISYYTYVTPRRAAPPFDKTLLFQFKRFVVLYAYRTSRVVVVVFVVASLFRSVARSLVHSRFTFGVASRASQSIA